MPLKQILRMEKPPNRKDYDPPGKTAVQQAQQVAAPHRKGPNFAKKKDKFSRKRSQSFSGINSKFCPPYKYRTRPMLPTKFLLGGNICDPLNLNSLQDEEVNRTVNAITPKSSPIPTPPQRRGHIEVIIPPNIHDPLNLIGCADDAEYEQQLTSPLKKGSKRRKKKKRTSSATTEPSDADISASEAQTPDLSNDSAKIPDLQELSASAEVTSPKEKLAKVTRDLKLELSPVKDKKRKSDTHKEGVKKLRRLDSMDKIVSPVVPQPGAWLKRALQFNRSAGPSSRGQHCRPSVVKEPGARTTEKVPHFRDKNKAYQYGNYNRYYGYRNPNHEVDSRLRCFAAHRHIFAGKSILDIGCNIGHITLSIARDFGAKSVVGIDIDKKLIGIARKNVRHYVNCNDSPRDEPGCTHQVDKSDRCFPISMPILYGPVDVPGMQNQEVKGRGFPHNVTFVQGNYVLEDDSLICTEQPQFDVILCLSITKWLHLNWGDQGLKQAFRRMYAQLKPGGMLILEPQSWASYKQKKTLTETIYKNYNSIEFFPEKFTQYLLSSEVGFAKSEIMGQPHHAAKGFQRPIQVFTRSNLSPSQSQRSYSFTPSHTATTGIPAAVGGAAGGAGKQVYTCLPSPDTATEEPAAVVRLPDQVQLRCEAVPAGRDEQGTVGGTHGAGTTAKARTKADRPGEAPGAADEPAMSSISAESASCSVADQEEQVTRCTDTAERPDKPEEGPSVADNQAQANTSLDKPTGADKITDPAASKAISQVTSALSSSSRPVTAGRVPDNQGTGTGKPLNQVPSPSVGGVNSRCNNINDCGWNNVSNVVGHLGTTIGATGDTVGTNKRKHTPPAGPEEGGTPVKRTYISPVKRKPADLRHVTAVKRTGTDTKFTKRKNDQSTTPSTAGACTSVQSTLTGTNLAENAAETRLENTPVNPVDTVTSSDQNTTGKSAHSTDNRSKRYRLMQRTKCMMDNT